MENETDMTNMSALNELIGRLEKAETGSAELDGRVWCWLHGKTFLDADDLSHMPGRVRVSVGYKEPPKRTRLAARPPAHALTRSIDAVVALINERLPGADYLVKTCRHDKEPCWAEIFTGDDMFTGEAATAPCALLIACLKAIATTEKGAKS